LASKQQVVNQLARRFDNFKRQYTNIPLNVVLLFYQFAYQETRQDKQEKERGGREREEEGQCVMCRINQHNFLKERTLKGCVYLFVIDLQHRFCIFLSYARIKAMYSLQRDEGHNRSQTVEPDVPNRSRAYACVCSLHI